MQTFDNDEAGYRAWISSHPNGFVLNSWNPPWPKYLAVHLAACHTINPDKTINRKNWTKAYIKVCADTEKELMLWAENEWGKTAAQVLRCSFCHRLGTGSPS